MKKTEKQLKIKYDYSTLFSYPKETRFTTGDILWTKQTETETRKKPKDYNFEHK